MIGFESFILKWIFFLFFLLIKKICKYAWEQKKNVSPERTKPIQKKKKIVISSPFKVSST